MDSGTLPAPLSQAEQNLSTSGIPMGRGPRPWARDVQSSRPSAHLMIRSGEQTLPPHTGLGEHFQFLASSWGPLAAFLA